MIIKKNTQEHNKPIIGITLGDYNGIGPEVILKALGDNRLLNMCTPVIYGSMKILSKYRKLLGLEEWYIHQIKDLDNISYKKVNLIQCFEDTEISPGQVTLEAGKAAFSSLEAATKDLLRHRINAIVTAPINKNNIQNEHFQFTGHTEYFTENFNAPDSLMLMVSEQCRIGLVSGHLPLKEVVSVITKEKITFKLNLLIKSLQNDFNITKPKIAVLGLNPHAGEEGLLGMEEKEIIEPVIKEFRKRGMLVYGPYPADGFFGAHKHTNYDAILGMYHDQGLIAFKMLSFKTGINFTAGLPVIRTSPDHGTAYNIAGKNIADATSMRQAIYLACDLIKARQTIALSVGANG